MAIGIRYYGQGTRPLVNNNPGIVRAFGRPAVEDNLDTSGIDDSGIDFSTTSSAASGRNAQTAADRLQFDRDRFERQFALDQTNAQNTQRQGYADYLLDQQQGIATLNDAQDARYAAQLAALAEQRRQRTGAMSQEAYIRSIMGRGVDPTLAAEITRQETGGKNFIDTQAANLLTRLSNALTGSRATTTTGYDNLRNYLTANPAAAYQTAQRAVPTVATDALSQYLQGQGVDPAAAQPSLDQANAQAAGGANNYNQLLNVLAGAESAGQSSRLAEEQMGRTLAGSQLESIYGAGRAGVEGEQLKALNDLATQISNARIGAQTQASAQEQSLQQALATILGQGYSGSTEIPDIPATGITRTRTPAPVVATETPETPTATTNKKGQAVTTEWQKKVFAAHPNFTGTFNEAKKKFPKLYATYLASQKKK